MSGADKGEVITNIKKSLHGILSPFLKLKINDCLFYSLCCVDGCNTLR